MQNKIVLIIEDEPIILNNISTILQLSGCTCHKAANGVEALSLLQTLTPNLIMCDVMMPDMNGFEVLQYVQQQPQLKHIPFCFLSARADVVDIDNGLALGAAAYITKPFLAKDLLATVNRLVSDNNA